VDTDESHRLRLILERFISAKLYLRFKQWSKPVKVTFVGLGR